MRRLPPALCAALFLFPLTFACAQTPTPTLDTALRAARPPASGVALAVGGSRVFLPPDAAPPASSSLARVADAFGRIVRRFGSVTAVAPPTMTRIPDRSPDTVSPPDAFKMLAASLSDAQWAALTSPRGLGLSDLKGAQADLFVAVFPRDGLFVNPLISRVFSAAATKDISGEAASVRLRLMQRVRIGIPTGKNSWIGAALVPKPDDPPNYHFVSGPRKMPEVGENETVNTSKHGQLNLDVPQFGIAVETTGVKTVGELVTRIGQATRLELYADGRLEKLSVTFVGPAQRATAADLLRALAFCVTGTYRVVGPAVVLTDDIVGIATREQARGIADSTRYVARKKLLDAAGDKIVARHNPRDLPFGDDPLALTAAQRALPSMSFGTIQSVSVPLAQLTPAQQAMARRMAAAMNQEAALAPAEIRPNLETPNLDNPIELNSRLSIQAIFPSLDGPVEMSNGSLNDLRYTLFHSPTQEKAENDARAKEEAAAQAAREKAAPPLKTELVRIARRAVLVHARTPEDAKKAVAAAKSLGLNEVWLDTFYDAALHLDILTAAQRAAKSAGLTVRPVVNLLDWGRDALPSQTDLTVTGERSDKADAARFDREVQTREPFTSPPAPVSNAVWVSPIAPGVRETLADALRALSKLSGPAGIVWRFVEPPGYQPPKDGFSSSDIVRPPLGYTEAFRLAFLRQFHADPLDVTENVRPPFFQEFELNRQLAKDWDWTRYETNRTLLRTLYPIVRGPLLVANPRSPHWYEKGPGDWFDGWFGTWDAAQKPYPAYRETRNDPRDGPPSSGRTASEMAKSQSHLAYAHLKLDDKTTAGRLTTILQGELGPKEKWDGFVLDWGATKSVVDALTKLAGTPQK